jgi:hypothetical protein
MLDQIFELSRKAMESSLQIQQAMVRHWTQDLPSMSPLSAGLSADWGGAMRKRWIEITLEMLNRQREAFDANYRATIQAIEKLMRVAEAKSSEDSVKAMEEVWRTMLDAVKNQSEAQFREFQSWIEKSLDLARKAEA